MLRKLLGTLRQDIAAPAIPPGRRVYAVGDIHGRDDLLAMLLERIDADNSARGPVETRLVFLGDYIDRGPDSAAVVERLIRLSHEDAAAVFLMGNHEEVLLCAAEGDLQAAELFDRIGGHETMRSYGVDEEAYAAGGEVLFQLIRDHVPGHHRDWMAGLAESHREGDYLFVHAGVRPNIPIDRQRPGDMRWIRDEFLDHDAHHGAMVVHGHSISFTPTERRNRIGIDTGAYRSGTLTALGLEGTERWFVTADLP